MTANDDGRSETKKKEPRARGWHRLARHRTEPSGNVEDLAAQLAPLEEQTAACGEPAGANNNDGAIYVDTEKLKLPEGIGADGAKSRSLFGIEPVVLVIIALMIAFVLFIAWQISQTPTTIN